MSPTALVSQRDIHHDDLADAYRPAIDNAFIEDRLCPGCKKSAVTEHGGLVVAFGCVHNSTFASASPAAPTHRYYAHILSSSQSFFHVDCFKCAKCGDQVNADTNLLLLSDGSPICANCSYSCNVCNLPILDEAIMTGDDSYHAHCFKCKVCDTRIDELVFAKTSHGIYCMNCHNKRMIRLREHAQRKAERNKEKAAANSSSLAKPRERDAKGNGVRCTLHVFFSSTNFNPKVPSPALQAPQPTNSRNSPSTRIPSKSPHDIYVGDAFATASQISPSTNLSASFTQPFNLTVAPPLDKVLDHERPPKQDVIPLLNAPSHQDIEARRKSYDDGVRPLNVLFGIREDQNQPSSAASTTSGGDRRLSISPSFSPTDLRPCADAVLLHSSESQDSLAPSVSRRDKRRSINPAISLSELGVSSTPSSLSLSPHSPNGYLPSERMQMSPSPGGLSSYGSSPSNEYFRSKSPLFLNHGSALAHPESRSPRPSGEYRQHSSRSESPARRSEDSQNQTIVVKSPPSISLGSVPPSKHRLKIHTSNGLSRDRPSTSTGHSEPRKSQDRHRYEPRPHSSSLSLQSLVASRPGSVSPSHRADVPSSVESEGDTDEEAQNRVQPHSSTPPTPPTKDDKPPSLRTRATSNSYPEADSSLASPDSEDLSESVTAPLQRISHSTYIAPALPPIRLSMNAADFSELLNSVGGFPSLKSLDQLAQIAEAPHNPAKVDDLTPKTRSPAIPSVDPSRPPAVSSKSVAQSPTVYSRQRSQSATSNGNSETSTSTTLNSSRLNTGAVTRITLTEPESSASKTLNGDSGDTVLLRLKEALADARERGMQQLNMDRAFAEAILSALETTRADFEQLRSKFDGVKVGHPLLFNLIQRVIDA